MPIHTINVDLPIDNITNVKTILVQSKITPVQLMVNDMSRPHNIFVLNKILSKIKNINDLYLIMFPELAFSSMDLVNIVTRLKDFNGNVIFIGGFGFTYGDKLIELIDLLKISHFFGQYEQLTEDLRYNFGTVIVKFGNIFEKYFFVKNFADQNIEISLVDDLYLSNTILKLCLNNIVLYPLICADIICSTENSPSDLIKSDLINTTLNNNLLIILPLLLITKKPTHPLWEKSFSRLGNLIDFPYYLLMCNESIENATTNNNLTGVLSNINNEGYNKIYNNNFYGVLAEILEAGLFCSNLKVVKDKKRNQITSIEKSNYKTEQKKNNFKSIKIEKKDNLTTVYVPKKLQQKEDIWCIFISTATPKISELINNSINYIALKLLKYLFKGKISFLSPIYLNIISFPELTFTIKGVKYLTSLIEKQALSLIFFSGLRLITKDEIRNLCDNEGFNFLNNTDLGNLKESYLYNVQIIIIKYDDTFQKFIFLKNSYYLWALQHSKKLFKKEQILKINTLDTIIYPVIGDDLDNKNIQSYILNDINNNKLEKIFVLNLCSNLSFDNTRKNKTIEILTHNPKVLIYIICDTMLTTNYSIDHPSNSAIINAYNADKIFVKELHHVKYRKKHNYIIFKNRLNLPGISAGIIRWQQSAEKGRGTHIPIKRYILLNDSLKKVYGNKDAQELYNYMLCNKNKILSKSPIYVRGEIWNEFNQLIRIFEEKIFENKYKDAILWPKVIIGVERQKENIIRADEVSKYSEALESTIPIIFLVKNLFDANYSINNNLYGQLYKRSNNLDILIWKSPFYSTYYIINLLQQIASLSGSAAPLIVFASGCDNKKDIKDMQIMPDRITDFTMQYRNQPEMQYTIYLSRYRFIYFINLVNFIEKINNFSSFNDLYEYVLSNNNLKTFIKKQYDKDS